MNIWFFNHYAVPPWFYPLARPYNFAKYLLKKGHNVTIFAASTVHNSSKNLIDNGELYKMEKVDGINYIYIKTSNYKSNGLDRIKNMFEYTIRLFKVTKKISKPDVIMATSVHPLACVAGIKIAKKYKCKCIVEIADLWPLTLVEMGALKSNSLITKVLYKLERWIYIKAHSIIFTMEGGRDYIIDKGWDKDIDISKIYHINNGVDLKQFNYNKKNYVIKDDDLDNQSTFKVIYTGSIRQANHVKQIVDMAEIIMKKVDSEIQFLIYGDGSEKEELQEYCFKHNINNIKFKGYLDKKYIPYILTQGNLNIIVGKDSYLYKYGFSQNKFFDYLASGKPIISNRDCHHILVELKCGLIVKGESAEALAEGILKFYNMPKEEYDIYCQNALRAAKDFDFKVLTDKLEQVILED